MRRGFDAQLRKLGEELIAMGAMVEEAIENACKALITQKILLEKTIM